MIISVTNQSKNFYMHLGKIFGSRQIEKITGDRIYDDDDKIWHLYFKQAVPVAFVSTKDHVIRNIWADDIKCLQKVLEKIKNEVKESIVTRNFIDVYKDAGYKVKEYSPNFVIIRGEYNE
ncbi:MAG: hypothetical protein E6600_04510 [Anaerocolumna aminovalerica]|uniref:hypothetical protein n=1 Tax=Anaerocolumna aminovalerica TaxID=1527 RepID=UPI002913E12C|nr:hypothetical protein [Anaerocolumna aminovalerica]MDU6263744.1 hypothetical protein [Anaerocolumna aminovalerica]